MGMSVQDILCDFYGKINIFSAKNGWATDFDFEGSIGKKLTYDLVDAVSGEVRVKDGTKLTKKVIEKLKEEKFKSYVLTDDILLGYVMAENLIDPETGEVLLEAGSLVTSESLEVLTQFLLSTQVNLILGHICSTQFWLIKTKIRKTQLTTFIKQLGWARFRLRLKLQKTSSIICFCHQLGMIYLM